MSCLLWLFYFESNVYVLLQLREDLLSDTLFICLSINAILVKCLSGSLCLNSVLFFFLFVHVVYLFFAYKRFHHC